MIQDLGTSKLDNAWRNDVAPLPDDLVLAFGPGGMSVRMEDEGGFAFPHVRDVAATEGLTYLFSLDGVASLGRKSIRPRALRRCRCASCAVPT